MKHDRHQGTAAETTTKKNWHKMQKPEKGEEPACGGKEKLLKIPRGNAKNTYQYVWMAKTAKSLSHN